MSDSNKKLTDAEKLIDGGIDLSKKELAELKRRGVEEADEILLRRKMKLATMPGYKEFMLTQAKSEILKNMFQQRIERETLKDAKSFQAGNQYKNKFSSSNLTGAVPSNKTTAKRVSANPFSSIKSNSTIMGKDPSATMENFMTLMRKIDEDKVRYQNQKIAFERKQEAIRENHHKEIVNVFLEATKATRRMRVRAPRIEEKPTAPAPTPVPLPRPSAPTPTVPPSGRPAPPTRPAEPAKPAEPVKPPAQPPAPPTRPAEPAKPSIDKAAEAAKERAREEAERKAREEAAKKAKEEADSRIREEAARKAREEADRKAREEAAKRAKEETERKTREEAAKRAKEETERKAREAAERAAEQTRREQSAERMREGRRRTQEAPPSTPPVQQVPPARPGPPATPAPGAPAPPTARPAPSKGPTATRQPFDINANIINFVSALKSRGITDKNLLAGVLGNAMKETGLNQRPEVSYANTSIARLETPGLFGTYKDDKGNIRHYEGPDGFTRLPTKIENGIRVTDTVALQKLKNDPEAFFERIYGMNWKTKRGDGSWKNPLGNTQPGDGYKFRGRGYLQLTGREMYTNASKAVFGDNRLVENPDLVNDPLIASATSAWLIQKRSPGMAKSLGFDINKLTPEQAQILATSVVAGKIVNPNAPGFTNQENYQKVAGFAELFRENGIYSKLVEETKVNSDLKRDLSANQTPTVIIAPQTNTNKNTTRSAPASQPNVNPMLGR